MARAVFLIVFCFSVCASAGEIAGWWPYVPLQVSGVAEVATNSWCYRPLDGFVLARLHAQGGELPRPAKTANLVRRASYDLTGLPPSVEVLREVERNPAIYPRLVEEWLASPRFGEAWGRHWLDVARFAESITFRGLIFKEAWRYRDYVIDAFNSDLPIDEFIREQIAGDLMSGVEIEKKARRQIATTYLLLGNFNYEDKDREQLRMDIVDEQIDTIGKTFLGLSFACARCHDHKSEPISQRDYFAMAGILANTQSTREGNLSGWLELPLPVPPGQELEIKTHERKIQELKRKIRRANERVEASSIGETSANQNSETIAELESALRELEESGPRRPHSMAVRDVSKPGDTRICIRGNVHQPGEIVPRGFPESLSYPGIPKIDARASGRLQLAEWLASPSNPLTARVFVNRVWHWLFGAALCGEPDSFGSLRGRTANSDLLDYLAAEFVRHGWSVKWLVREIMLSHTYQLEAVSGMDSGDQELPLPRRRPLHAEQMRDTILMASGQMDMTMHGPSFNRSLEEDYSFEESSKRRSIYLPYFRNALPDLLVQFDCADPSVVTGQRNHGIVASQALYMLNSEFIQEQARMAAGKLLSETKSDEEHLRDAYRLVLGRIPAADVREVVQQHLADCKKIGMNELDAWSEIYQALFASVDFRYLD